MTRGEKGWAGWVLAGAVVCGLLSVSGLAGYEKKLRVATDYAHVYLQPSENSPVVGTVERGVVLSLLYSGKMKRAWYYICFKSEKSGNTKSGYILDTEVELLFDPLQTITIQEEQQGLRVQYPPRYFGEMHWGVTKKQVVEAEGKPSWQTKADGADVLVYEQAVINLDCDIEYRFVANKLHQTRFCFAGSDLKNKNSCLEDYRRVKDALIQKFGRPVEESMDWRDGSYREDFSAWGTAVGLGHLEMRSRWLTPETEIVARLSGENEETYLVLLFTGLRLRDVASKSQGED